jgi:TolB-like protein/DNA-binding winged helix-turn-helix (wHTH) protein
VDTNVRFGVFEIDQRARELRKCGVRIKLEDQPFEVLVALIEKPGDVVSRIELQARLWPEGTHVDFDKSLTKVVNKLRTALSDSPTTPRYIETLSRRGYRFVAPLEARDVEVGGGIELKPALVGDEPRLRRRFRLPLWAVSIAVCIFGLLAGALGLYVGKLRQWPNGAAGGRRIESLVVLPIQNLSGDTAREYYADGLTDELISRLARIGSIRVISRTSTMRYKGARQTVAEIARALHVDAVVEGSVTRSGERVHINVKLVHAATDQQLWGSWYEGNAD